MECQARRRVGGRGDGAPPAHHAAETDASHVCASMNAYLVAWVTSSSRRALLPRNTRWHSLESRSPASARQPIFSAMEQIVAHCVGCASCCSCTPRTARSLTSGVNGLLAFRLAPLSRVMLLISQSGEPPPNPGASPEVVSLHSARSGRRVAGSILVSRAQWLATPVQSENAAQKITKAVMM
jgi:hypothetical protein